MKAIGLALVVTVLVGCSSERSAGFAHKAVADVSSASSIVGGFSDTDRMLYERGLRELHRTGSKPGQYTIAQLIDQERSREFELTPQAIADRKEHDRYFGSYERNRDWDRAHSVPVHVVP